MFGGLGNVGDMRGRQRGKHERLFIPGGRWLAGLLLVVAYVIGGLTAFKILLTNGFKC